MCLWCKALHSKAFGKLLNYFFADPQLTPLITGDEGQAFWTDHVLQSQCSFPNLLTHIHHSWRSDYSNLDETPVYTRSHLNNLQNIMWENIKIHTDDRGSTNNNLGSNQQHPGAVKH